MKLLVRLPRAAAEVRNNCFGWSLIGFQRNLWVVAYDMGLDFATQEVPSYSSQGILYKNTG